MAFNPLIPKSTDQLSLSQNQILGNFAVLGAIAGNANPNSRSINESGLNVGFNFVNFALPGAVPATGDNQMALYTAQFGDPLTQELWIVRQNTAIASPLTRIPITASKVGNDSGWTYLPSGVLMAWGQGVIPASGLLTVVYGTSLPTGFPGFTNANPPQLTRISASGVTVANMVVLRTFINTQFQVKSNPVPVSGGGTVPFNWLVVGK